jgi:hypothetical protein
MVKILKVAFADEDLTGFIADMPDVAPSADRVRDASVAVLILFTPWITAFFIQKIRAIRLRRAEFVSIHTF